MALEEKETLTNDETVGEVVMHDENGHTEDELRTNEY